MSRQALRRHCRPCMGSRRREAWGDCIRRLLWRGRWSWRREAQPAEHTGLRRPVGTGLAGCLQQDSTQVGGTTEAAVVPGVQLHPVLPEDSRHHLSWSTSARQADLAQVWPCKAWWGRAVLRSRL